MAILDRLAGIPAPALEKDADEPRWLAYRELLIQLAAQALQTSRLLSHPATPGAPDTDVTRDVLLPLGYQAMRQLARDVDLAQEIDVWHVQLVSSLGGIAAEVIRIEAGGAADEASEQLDVARLERLGQDAVPVFRVVGRAGVKCLDLAAMAMLAAAASASCG